MQENVHSFFALKDLVFKAEWCHFQKKCDKAWLLFKDASILSALFWLFLKIFTLKIYWQMTNDKNFNVQNTGWNTKIKYKACISHCHHFELTSQCFFFYPPFNYLFQYITNTGNCSNSSKQNKIQDKHRKNKWYVKENKWIEN